MGTPIFKRPKEVKDRATFGHWELDSMVSIRGESKGCFATFVERKNRFYIADPYSSWQRDPNENSNGLLREFYPKKADLANVKQSNLTHNLFLINSRPRECLGWKSSIQVFLHELAHLA